MGKSEGKGLFLLTFMPYGQKKKQYLNRFYRQKKQYLSSFITLNRK